VLRLLALVVVAALIGYPIFAQARARAKRSPAARWRVLAGAAVGLAAGGILAFWVPRYVPQTQGSPAFIVVALLLWILGGGLCFLSAAALLGGLVGRADPFSGNGA
jgi:hypothetical protein